MAALEGTPIFSGREHTGRRDQTLRRCRHLAEAALMAEPAPSRASQKMLRKSEENKLSWKREELPDQGKQSREVVDTCLCDLRVQDWEGR
jgi:hypothetical protein